MTDATTGKPAPSGSKAFPAIISAFIASFTMNQFSLHGVNFETAGVSSEVVKSLLEGSMVGFFTWLSWTNIVNGITEIIVSVKDAVKSWRNAAKS
jgi:hypothetical protein